jgi:O-antigen/teichoic acid export membrane protein
MKLVTGTLVAQLLPFFILPILTRTMGAIEFGIFSLFFTTTVMLGTIAALRFEYAINAANNERDAKQILILCAVLNLLALGLLIIVMSGTVYFKLLSPIWLLLPFSAISMSLNQTYYSYANFKGEFNVMSHSKVCYAGICALTQFILVYIFSLNAGAFIGIVVGYAVSTFYMFYVLRISFTNVNFKKLFITFKRYNKYPKLVFPGTFINFISGNLPIYFFGYFFGPTQAGYYSLATRVAGVPTAMIGRAVGEVFRSRAKSELTKGKDFSSIFKRVSVFCFILGVAGFSFLFLFAPFLFDLVFGDGWGSSALFVQILIPMFLMQFTTAPIAYSLMLSGWQRQELYWQFFRLFTVLTSIFIISIFSTNILHFVGGVSFAMTFTFIVYFLLCFQSSRKIVGHK